MVIEIESLRKEFQVLGGVEVAVDNFTLTVEDGEFVTFVGPSGCGKTTTLRCISGLETPSSGSILFHGTDVTDLPANRRNIAMMFQSIALYPHMNIRDNICYPLKVRDVRKEERYRDAEEAAELLEITNLLDKYPGELSGGQRQRAALARTIVQDPVLFLMDEPLSDLDAKLKIEIRKEIQQVHRRSGKPTIYVTHDQEEALTMSDRVVVMNDGKIEQIDAPNELYYSPVNKFVANFVGNPSMNFVDGRISSENGGTTVEMEEGRVNLHVDSPYDTERSDVIVGFRPDSLQLGDEADGTDFEVRVELIEQTGNQVVVTTEGPLGQLTALSGASNPLVEGETTRASISRGSLYLFDVESHERIRRKTASSIA